MQLVVTDSIREALELAALETKHAQDSEPNGTLDHDFSSTAKASSISHKLLHSACSLLVKAYPDRPHYAFHRLIKGSRIEFVCPKPREITPEYIKFMEKVKIKLENKEYEDIVGKMPHGKSRDALGSISGDLVELRKVSGQMMSLLNIFISMAAVFTALYIFAERLWEDQGFRVLFGLFGALVVGFAEGWFYTRDWLMDEVNTGSKKVAYRPNLNSQVDSSPSILEYKPTVKKDLT
ncbi:hypothetical protein BATDEDRAFT_85567 [Batrachochytrium dendrobatidis JAM81]|uniref:Uncharacterized protein n=2 Tax=Batrachochytrium dendrobatidis TaxID=109871 RepID=F4NSV8_BATDJ|nr:uncharacterized protein BATDEDRAFT_85567 [Batrachochytrium dendrobatidis JAM81]EGF83862.1 hypothetical protein BATDEDRAFT_85567 [Batrachochytrium dendrobatidis JAM81]OAJ36087.1 hypothetical protein BDEG_20299 [Batrachochytrium dendrobatidis JEL423]|eukprot:XP_006676250.1 hypothetical protein BATDEDRAFT_85567 [Batrachochytrium dendrobatidis JAM81]